jgi:hypothetical protein
MSNRGAAMATERMEPPSRFRSVMTKKRSIAATFQPQKHPAGIATTGVLKTDANAYEAEIEAMKNVQMINTPMAAYRV